ncbi:MAG: 4-hydroxy-tetrahydrodipicolinate reductase [Spirochaetaceae bacterium]|jgi:4-hydroxy-tetrahydrodipicolinate reductase|nr:4-hydroxy-tetrahydrodipicolinate reductase [Spirochaetaceae bacterium]
MNIIISGYGRMGKAIAEQALEKGHTISAIIDPDKDASLPEKGIPVYKDIQELSCLELAKSDVAIDFTHPSVALDNIKKFAQKKISLVVGTTGWYDELSEVKKIIENSGSSLLYASNFSLGVNLFYKIVSYTARLFDAFDEYDVAGFEVHHNKKADSPSGTAKSIARIVLDNMDRKTKIVYDKLDRPPENEELHFASLRGGLVPGTHTLYFDSPADTIEITHRARNRNGLAAGAIIAAEWLVNTVRSGNNGVYEFTDVLGK